MEFKENTDFDLIGLGEVMLRLSPPNKEKISQSETFEKNAEETRKKVEELYSLWDKKIDGLAYIMSYDMLDRADEAVISLYSAYSISDTEDFILARAKLCDSLKRLLMFCGFSIKSLA